ncbi:MAG: hypothetical protein WAN89_02690 [Lawsonella sp.]
MDNLKKSVAKVFSPLVRERLYIVAAALMSALVAFGVLTDNEASLWSALVVAVIGAVFSVVNAETNWRVALYTVAGAAAVVFQSYGILGDAEWSAIVGLVAAVLGVTTAAAKAPTCDVDVEAPELDSAAQ